MTGIEKIAALIRLANDATSIHHAIERACEHLHEAVPHNACATTLSYLLAEAGIDAGIHENAGDLARTLEARHWIRVPVGEQQAGDVAVSEDGNSIPGPDHIFVVAKRLGADLMLIADNQQTAPHLRYASGRGKTPVAYFLRGGGD